MKKYQEFLEELIKKENKNFTVTEKKIANFILQHFNEVPFLSIHDFADRIGVGRASILRFTNKIGFDGYLSLKKEMNSRMINTLAPMEKFRLTLDHTEKKNGLLNDVGQQEVDNINSTLNKFNSKNFKKAVTILSKANMVYTIGYNLSSFISEIFCYLLQRIGVKSISTTFSGRSIIDQLRSIDKNDVVIAISLPPYSEQTIKAAKYAKERGVKVISFTPSLTAPIIPYSSVVLQVQTESRIFSNSLSAISVLMYSLVYEVAINNKSRSLEALNELLAEID